MTIATISAEVYAERPSTVLYHYTSLAGIAGIVESQSIWATELRYFNDAAELRHTAELLSAEIVQRLERADANHVLLKQFREWLRERLTMGHMLFVASFTANGNLLSQWRSYCPPNKGVSVGFEPGHLCQCAGEQSYNVAKCIYDNDRKKQIVARILDAIEELARKRGENRDPAKRHPSQSYHDIFEEAESDILRIATLLKHRSFQEEDEWRAVSPIVAQYAGSTILFRESKSMLIPYMDFSLQRKSDGVFSIEKIFVGPTPEMNLSMHSLKISLSIRRASPKQGISNCEIPYRS